MIYSYLRSVTSTLKYNCFIIKLGGGASRHILHLLILCLWGEFTLILEDVANILHLPICGNQNPFNIVLASEDKKKFKILRKSASNSNNHFLRFNNWIKYFGNAQRRDPCQLAALISIWLEKFVFYDFFQDCLHKRLLTITLSIVRDNAIPLAPCSWRICIVCWIKFILKREQLIL